MQRPSDEALLKWAEFLKGEKPQDVEWLALHTVHGGTTGIVPDAAVLKGQLPGDVRQHPASLLFYEPYWSMFDKEQQRAIMRARCLYDLFWFTTAVLGYNKTRPGGGVELDPELHGEFCEELAYRKPTWFVALMFRNSLKSTIISIADTLRRYLLKPHTKRLIVSDTRAVAVGLLSEIKAHIETNELLQHLWPERFNPGILKRHKWAEDAITLPGNNDRRVGTVQVAGIDGNITGVHVPEIVLDDVVTQGNSTSPEQRQKVLDAIKMLLSILSPGGRFWVAGTRYHYEDAYAWMLKNAIEHPQEHYVHVKPIYKDDGTSAWPALFTPEEINKRKMQGSHIFSCQYLLEPVPDDSEFQRGWVEDSTYAQSEMDGDPDKPEDKGIKGDLVDIVMTCDPAFSEKETRNADFACLMISGIKRNGHIYVIDYYMKQMHAPEFVTALIDMYNRYSPSLIGIESVAAQKGLIQLIEKAFDERKLIARFHYITRNKTEKDLRIRQALQPYFSKGMVHLRKDMDLLALQLRRFPSWKKDGLDCLADAVQILRPRRRGEMGESFAPEAAVNSVTGR